jgi:predicted helicase
MVYQLPKAFRGPDSENLLIAVSNQGARSPFSVLMTSHLPDLNVWIDPTPCFPLYLYDGEPTSEGVPNLFGDSGDHVPDRRYNVTDHALATYKALDPAIDREDIFFYVYGILHSPDYRTVFA